MGLGDRLRRLEGLRGGRHPRSPERVYDRIRREAQESIEKSLNADEEPLYRIADNGDVETADGRPINHYGDFIRALDQHIQQLDAEIAASENH